MTQGLHFYHLSQRTVDVKKQRVLRSMEQAQMVEETVATLREQGLNVEPSSSRRCATCVPRH